MTKDPALDYTSPENRGICGFCGEEEGGYAVPKDGKWVAACWSCVKPPNHGPEQHRNPVGSRLQTESEPDLNK